MIALRADRQTLFSWHAPRGSRRARWSNIVPTPLFLVRLFWGATPPMLRGKIPGGGEGLTLESTEDLVFQQRSVLDPVLILTSSLDSSIRVLVLLSRQN